MENKPEDLRQAKKLAREVIHRRERRGAQGDRRSAPELFEREVQRQLVYHQRALEQLARREREFAALHAGDSDGDLAAYLQEWAKRLKRSPHMCEVSGGEYIMTRFGSWEQALAQAGLPPAHSNPPKRWHRLVYLDELKRQRRLGMEERRRAAEQAAKE